MARTQSRVHPGSDRDDHDMTTLIDRIESGRVFVLDGAMGTMLYSRGVFVNVCYDELNLTRPDLVREIHRDYLEAGAQILETNTFGANPVKLSSYGLDDRTEEINHAAALLAREAAGEVANVVGAIGPLGIRIEPFGPTSYDEAMSYFARQADGLMEGGVDGFSLETFADLNELKAAYHAVRSRSNLPVIAQMTITEAGTTPYGTDVETIATTVSQWGAEVAGLNCSVGPAGMLEAIERMAQVTRTPLCVQANAGLPRTVGDRKIYLASPEYMARYARRLIDAGARFVGGCCGTTPEHIKHIRAEVASTQPRLGDTVAISRGSVRAPAGVAPVPMGKRSAWGAKLAAGTFVRSVELLPPMGWHSSALLANCRTLMDAGLDAVNLLDGPRAKARMGALPSAILIEREVGIETVMHYTCRDRNMLGMLSDLYGAAAAGIRNVLLVTGDAPVAGPYPDATAVFDIDSIGLTNVVYRLNHGVDPGGNPIGAPTEYVIGVAMNPGAVDPEAEAKRMFWKVDAGAEFAVTQPIFDPAQLDLFLERIAEYRIPVIGAVWPFSSVRNAEYLANEVPGVTVPDDVIARMRAAHERGEDAALEEGIAIAREMYDCIAAHVQGVMVSAPRGRVDVALEVLGTG